MGEPYYRDDSVTLWHGDCLDVLRTLPDCSVDSVVTDPPYGLGFMGREWDDLPPGVPFAAECLRVLKPGGHMLAFGGSRTWHRLASAIEDAGFEIRDSIAWLYGSGFPKSLDVSKAIDKAAGVEFSERPAEGVGFMRPDGRDGYNVTKNRLTREGDSTPEAEQWQGWGTALKPAFEPIVVGRKPLVGTVAANVLAHGTGALNIDGCRVGTGDNLGRPQGTMPQPMDWGNKSVDAGPFTTEGNPAGRWPANVILDETQATELDKQSGTSNSKRAPRGEGKGETGTYGVWGMAQDDTRGHDDPGGASRFFPTFHYEPKAPTTERPTYTREGETSLFAGSIRKSMVGKVAHPTVKPLELMRWLVRLVTPPGGTVLEPFAGSGTTAEACVVEGFLCIAIEREPDYLPLIVQRLSKPIQVTLDFG